ncbi:unnamed protein product [Microthlaspi erraticum]|uniref:tyrosine--tRNA ligase n=1 Tax=Microthlaspi erraticum TaxID=1685480 RepID=A0A6D2IYL8_9BRAS|nr:unnamed protein product [Microthlaspi erraticum]
METASIFSSSHPPSSPPMRFEEVVKRFQTFRNIATEEPIEEEKLRTLLANKASPICYDRFEPSGRMHIAQGLMKVINVNKLTSSGFRVKIVIADCFTQLNNKRGGDLKKARVVGEYFKEICKAVGMMNNKVEFLWSSEVTNAKPDKYWPLVIDIARIYKVRDAQTDELSTPETDKPSTPETDKLTDKLSTPETNKLTDKPSTPETDKLTDKLSTAETDKLSTPETDKPSTAEALYPCVQCADILFLEADICLLGMDQREVNKLARNYYEDKTPVILSQHMLPGLKQGEESMSKSDLAIFMEDEEAQVNVKIKKAYCPPKIVEGNPCLEYVEHIVLPWFDEFAVERREEHGGDKTFKRIEEIVADYESGELHPEDLKKGLTKALNRILQPVRDHFKTDAHAKSLLRQIKAYKK